jgi:hypothetical protein
MRTLRPFAMSVRWRGGKFNNRRVGGVDETSAAES